MQKRYSLIFALGIVSVALVTALGLFIVSRVLGSQLQGNRGNDIFCTLEAKLCPDGSYVGRNSAKNCQFDDCPGQKACTDDARICPDGSSVGRDHNNNCEFFACPNSGSEPKVCTQDAMLCPDGSAVGRNPNNNCQFFPCP